MSRLRRVGSLEIDQDLDFQRREWRVQRVLWVGAALLLVLAVLGLFGTGPISSTTATSGDGTVAVDYHRFVRHDGRASLRFHVSGDQASNQQIALWISQGYIDNMQIEDITPQPTEVRSAGDRTIFVFAVDQPGDPLNATFSLRPSHIGRISGEAGAGDARLDIDQLSYP
jgi:hypothetical protein